MTQKLSEYSEHYQGLDSDGLTMNVLAMSERIEDFRLRLDLSVMRPWIKGPRVLDFPMGTGRMVRALHKDYEVHGFEISPQYVQRARDTYADAADRFRIEKFEAFADVDAFDTILSLRVLSNVADVGLALRNLGRALHKDGRLIFNYPPADAEKDSLDAALAAAGLRVVHTQRYDYHTAQKAMGRYELGLYTRLVGAINKGFVPYAVFALVERALGSKGTSLYVCERAT